MACQEQHWELEDTSHLQELETKGSLMVVGGQPPKYIFFLAVVFRMLLFDSFNAILNLNHVYT